MSEGVGLPPQPSTNVVRLAGHGRQHQCYMQDIQAAREARRQAILSEEPLDPHEPPEPPEPRETMELDDS